MFYWAIAPHTVEGQTSRALQFGHDAKFSEAVRVGRVHFANTYAGKDVKLRLYLWHGDGLAIDITPDELSADKTIYA